MIGFPLNNEKTDWFSLFYDELIIYKGIHGNFDDVVSDNGIGPTITRIRQAYKGNDKTMLTPEMIDKLNEIGFPWEARYKKIQEDNVSV